MNGCTLFKVHNYRFRRARWNKYQMIIIYPITKRNRKRNKNKFKNIFALQKLFTSTNFSLNKKWFALWNQKYELIFRHKTNEIDFFKMSSPFETYLSIVISWDTVLKFLKYIYIFMYTCHLYCCYCLHFPQLNLIYLT